VTDRGVDAGALVADRARDFDERLLGGTRHAHGSQVSRCAGASAESSSRRVVESVRQPQLGSLEPRKESRRQES
jgi:hypothetical protein